MSYYFKKSDSKLECTLCPHYCKLLPGKSGICGARKNTGEKIELLTYGVISGNSLDPVEKKPLYHFFPGTNIFSVGSYGCNMRCDYCQNYHISQRIPDEYTIRVKPENLINEALHSINNIGIAFTYNEPVIWFEFIKDVSWLAKENNIRTALISNGFINQEPLMEVISFIDAFNVDLKAFNDDFYRKLTGSEIKPVKESISTIGRSGRHLEITTLIIPGYNDSCDEMDEEARWIASEAGRETPLHLSRYFPMYKREDRSTPVDTIKKLSEIALKHLDYVYTGNMITEKGQDTTCPSCGKKVTKRSGYNIRLQNLDKDGKCLNCGKLIYNYFTSFSSSTKN